MVRQSDASLQRPPQDHQPMSKRRVLSLKPQPRLERRGQDGKHEAAKPLGDSVTSSTRTRFSVHTPGSIVSDNGTEFTCNAMLAWCKETGIDWHFIAPGKPIQNAFVESFNGRMRD